MLHSGCNESGDHGQWKAEKEDAKQSAADPLNRCEWLTALDQSSKEVAFVASYIRWRNSVLPLLPIPLLLTMLLTAQHMLGDCTVIVDKSPYRELRLLPTMHFSGAFLMKLSFSMTTRRKHNREYGVPHADAYRRKPGS
jgi:hypothetical protein